MAHSSVQMSKEAILEMEFKNCQAMENAQLSLTIEKDGR